MTTTTTTVKQTSRAPSTLATEMGWVGNNAVVVDVVAALATHYGMTSEYATALLRAVAATLDEEQAQ